MKILQLVQKPQRRGAEIFARELSHQLRSQNHMVRTIYLYPHMGSAPLPVEPSDVELSGTENHVLEKLTGINPVLLQRLRLQIAEFMPDVVQANGARTLKYGAFARRKIRKGEWVLIYRNIGNPGDWMHDWRRRFFYKMFIIPQLDGVVGVSRITLQRFVEFYNLSIPTTHIPRGVNVSTSMLVSRNAIRERNHTKSDAPTVIFVGSLSREKRPDRFLRIVSLLKAKLPSICAWIIGEGILRRDLEEQTRALKLESSTIFLGAQTDVASLIHASDLLLLTSDTEGIPGVILEAAVVGIPVVSTNVGGVAECVIDTQTGYLVERDNEERFAKLALELLNDPHKKEQMGERAKAWVEQNFEIGRIASRYLEFYKQLLSSSR